MDPRFVTRICGQEVSVEHTSPDLWVSGGMGRSSTRDGRILLNPAMPASVRDTTLVHEVIHYILDTNGFSEQSLNEVMVSVLGNCLAAWMKDNPELTAQLSRR